MRLNPKDRYKINILKEKYGYAQTSELIRYLVNTKIGEMVEERRKIQPQYPPERW
jgi:hypothetical protein